MNMALPDRLVPKTGWSCTSGMEVAIQLMTNLDHRTRPCAFNHSHCV